MTPNKAPSAIKNTLTKYLRSSRHYRDGALEDIAKDVLENVYGREYLSKENVTDYRKRIRAVLMVPGKGCVLFVESKHGKYWFIDGYSARYIYKPTTMRAALLTLNGLGVTTIKVFTERRPEMGSYWEQVGFTKVANHHYEMRVRLGS